MTISICIITYNHEKFIAQAIDSVLNQNTFYKKQIIIGEDFSTDTTRAICKDYANRYPDIIKLIPTEKNVGMLKNFHRTVTACDGKYVAFIEGDDYWTDPLKLQKQVDLLEANTDCSACFHNVILKQQRNEQNIETILHQSLPKDTFDTEDVLGPWFIPSSSFMFVNYADTVLPDWFFNCQYGDLPFMLLLSLKGKFKYIDEVMGVYRLHDKGMTTVHLGYDKIMVMVYVYASFDIHTNFKYHQTIRNAVIYEVDRHVPPQEIALKEEKAFFSLFLEKCRKKIKSIVYNN